MAAVAAPSSEPAAGAPEVEPGAGHERRYGVQVGEYALLLPAGTLCEIAAELPRARLPNTPPWLAGVMSQRGTMVPVVDLSVLLDGTRPDQHQRAWVLVVGQRESSIGLLVRHLPRSLLLQADECLAEPPTLHPRLDRYVLAAYRAADGVWFDWDLDAFFTRLGASLADSPSEASCVT